MVLIRLSQVGTPYSKTYICLLSTMMVTMFGIWVLMVVDTYVNANICLYSSKGGWASIFIHTQQERNGNKTI